MKILSNLRSTLVFVVLPALIFLTLTGCNSAKKDSSSKQSPANQPSSTAVNKPLLGNKQLQIYMLDVGQGDSLLIVTPEKKTILIDGGLAKSSETILASLQQHQITQIDLVVATHPHADHIGGLNKVLAAIPVKAFLDSGQAHPTQTYRKMLQAVKANVGNMRIARQGQTFTLDSGITLAILGPSEPLLEKVSGSEENANSVILKLTYGNFRMLFTGDSEDETEERLLENHLDLQAQVLKVAHHGSNYATTDEFLQAVKPAVAIISCGQDNDYGHPAPNTLARLKNAQIKVHRTDLEGEIRVISDGQNYQVQTTHPPTGDIWQGRLAPSRGKN
jgi:competence protein ComEC